MPWALDIKSGLILPTFENVQIYPPVALILKIEPTLILIRILIS